MMTTLLKRICCLLAATAAATMAFGDIRPYSVDYNGTGHIPMADNAGNQFPSLERGGPYNNDYPSAVVKNGYVNVTVTYYNQSSTPVSGGSISLHFFEGLGYSVEYGVSPASQPFSIGAYQYASATFTVGPFPNKVWPRAVYTPYAVIKGSDGLTKGGGPNSTQLYIVADTSKAPQAVPREGVLDDFCGFAQGASTLASAEDLSTKGLYFAQRFAYSDSTASSWTRASDRAFNLTGFLASYGYVGANCEDVSDYLSIGFNALGIDSTVAIYSSSPAYNMDGQFHSNPICLIGSNPVIDSTYTQSDWAWHQVTHETGYSSVFDVCAAQKYNATVTTLTSYRNPPVNWPLASYWQNYVASGSTSQVVGLVNLPATSTPSLELGPRKVTVY